MVNYVFLGPPGAGKGTMARMMSAEFGHAHISTGDILRTEIGSGSDLGRRAKLHVDGGELVPDAVVAAIVMKRLLTEKVRRYGFILDGYPRTLSQTALLDADLARISLRLDCAVLFEVDRELLLQRMTARRICGSCGSVYNVLFNRPAVEGVCDACGGALRQRRDDTYETAVSRLDLYERETSPLIEFYAERGLLTRVTGAEQKDDNYVTLKRVLGL